MLTPHIGGATTDTEARGAQMVADDLERLLAGEAPLNIVNPEVLLARSVLARSVAARSVADKVNDEQMINQQSPRSQSMSCQS